MSVRQNHSTFTQLKWNIVYIEMLAQKEKQLTAGTTKLILSRDWTLGYYIRTGVCKDNMFKLCSRSLPFSMEAFLFEWFLKCILVIGSHWWFICSANLILQLLPVASGKLTELGLDLSGGSWWDWNDGIVDEAACCWSFPSFHLKYDCCNFHGTCLQRTKLLIWTLTLHDISQERYPNLVLWGCTT